MSIRNNRIFGLAVPLSLADIPDNEQALLNLGLDIRDLDIIRGISGSGFDSNDLQSLSNLTTPIWRTFDRYINDVLTYNNALSRSAGADFRARGNLEVNGPISSSAFRYTLLDTFGTTPELRWGDISTSRVSSWSSIGNSISYGADVKIAGTITTGKLKTRVTPTARTFSSEIPTHKIKVKLNGVDTELLVMKGIPIQFKGFFRDFDCTINFQSSPVRNSWRVYNTNGTAIQDFPDVGSNTSSTLNYRSPFSAERFIEIYTNPEIITSLTLNNCSIQEIPKSVLPNLLTFNFSTNGLVEFPNLSFFSPTLRTLDLSNNPFFNGSDPDQRYFSSKIAAKIPPSLQSLNISGCFKGAFVQNQLNKFVALTSINANRSSFNTTSFFYPDSKNATGSLPNFYGINGVEASQVISSINFVNNDFRTITPGVQGGVEFTSLSDGGSGGSGYASGGDATYTNVTLTGGSGNGAVATIGVSNGVVNLVEITNPGTGYSVDNILSASNTQLGGTGSGLAIKVLSTVNVLSVKQQTKITTLSLRSNPNLLDSGFSLACQGTATTVDTYDTKLSIANCSNFSVLQTYNNQFNTGRGSLWSGWDGVFGSVGYPETDVTNFKFANCRDLRNHYNDYSDVRGYLPKYVGCPELRSYNFFSCNNIVAGRPGKRPIQSLFRPGGISQLGASTIGPGTGSYTFNLTKKLVNDTGANAPGVTQLATVEVSTDSLGNVTSYAVVDAGSGYTTSNKVTISGTQLGATSDRNLIIDITSVDPGFIKGQNGQAVYTDGTYELDDTRANTSVGRNARVQVVISGGNVLSYNLISGGQDYQTGESVTLSGTSLGGSGGGTDNNLRIKIAKAQPPKILYNDQFSENTKITTVDININNTLFAGEIESGAFTPIRDTLSFLRLYANGRIEGGFPNLDDASAIRTVYSNNQGWSGPVPKFTQGFNLFEVYLNDNKFDGTFEYKNKPVLDYVNYNNNRLTLISEETRLPVCRYFYFANNLLSGSPPELDVIAPRVEFVQLNNNNYNNYGKGLVSLPRLRTLDMSGNAIPTPAVDNILFDLVKNYNATPRNGVLINLQGGRMGAPTPYPVTTGIISSLSFTQPTLLNGNITSYGSLGGFSSGSVPIAGTYTSLGLNYRGAPGTGTGANINVTVNIAAIDNVVTAIGAATRLASGTQGEIKTLAGTFTNGGTTGLIAGDYERFDTGGASSGNTSAQVRVSVASATGPVTVTLLNGGSNYSKQRGDKIRIDSTAWNGPGNMDIDLGTVNEFTNGTNVLYTDTGLNSSGNTTGKVRVTVSNGVITSATLDTLPSGGGTGYTTSQSITISLPATGDFNTTNNVRFSVNEVRPKWYTAFSLSIAQINSGGSNYSIGNTLRTSNGITFRRTNGTNETGYLDVTVSNVTQQTNRSVFTGFGAVEYLRARGWTVQVNS